MTTNESGENANRIFIFTFSVAKETLLIRIWILGGFILINYWEIRTFSKIKVPIGTKKLELVPMKTCPKLKDPCWHSALASLIGMSKAHIWKGGQNESSFGHSGIFFTWRKEKMFWWICNCNWSRLIFGLVLYMVSQKQAEKLKSCKMKERWIKNDEEWWRMKDEWWRMMISNGQMNERTNGQTFAIVESLSRLKKSTLNM